MNLRLPGLPADATILRYDADGNLVGQLLHVDGELLEPLTLEPGEMLFLHLAGAASLFPIWLGPMAGG